MSITDLDEFVITNSHQPDITFFHEKLPDRFFERFQDHDRDAVDLVIVIGTSLTVAPVSEIPLALPPDVPHVYISRDVRIAFIRLMFYVY